MQPHRIAVYAAKSTFLQAIPILTRMLVGYWICWLMYEQGQNKPNTCTELHAGRDPFLFVYVYVKDTTYLQW